MIDGQLWSKWDEFWDIVFVFEGCKEIWDVFKVVVYVVEVNDYELVQVILDGVSIILFYGIFCECYDELGNCYQLFIYCLLLFVNLFLEYMEEESLEFFEFLFSVCCEFLLKVCLFIGKDVRFSVSLFDMVGQFKRQLYVQEGIELLWQWWFFFGKLFIDCIWFQEIKIQKDFVIQVIINQFLLFQD